MKLKGLLGTTVIFLIYRWMTLTFRHGDGNVYLYAGHVLTQGILPYRDYVFADPPILPFVIGFLDVVTHRVVLAYLFLPIVLEAANALLIATLLKRWKSNFYWLAPAVYLFSLPILRTSDHLQGSQLTVFFSLLGIMLWDTNKPLLSGISWALGCLTKLYLVPAYAGFLLAAYLSKRKNLIKKLLIGSLATLIVILLPFLLLAPQNFFRDVILFPLLRQAEFSKLTILGNYARDAWPLLIVGLIGILRLPQPIIVFPLLVLTIFFLLFKDIFYIYVVTVHWYVVTLCVLLVGNLKKKWMQWGLVGAFLIYLGWSLYQYQTKFIDYSRFDNAQAVAAYFKKQPDTLPLYGFHELTPLLALLADRRVYNNVVDTHPQLFATHMLDRDTISQSASRDGVYLLYLEQLFPDGSRFRSLDGTFFSKKIFDQSCTHQTDIPISRSTDDVVIGIYRCSSTPLSR
ncbi:hypothetical protein HY086_00915 [Candidatus Gottesmanbacteria bacterium]|nr:hypothetical protein [Candidatus Gottesmanbacteria bacterium]